MSAEHEELGAERCQPKPDFYGSFMLQQKLSEYIFRTWTWDFYGHIICLNVYPIATSSCISRQGKDHNCHVLRRQLAT